MDKDKGTFQIATSWQSLIASDFFDGRCALSGNYELTLIQVDINSQNLNYSGSSEPTFALNVSSPLLGGGVSNVPAGWLINLSIINQNSAASPALPDYKLQLNTELSGPAFIAQLQGSFPLIFGLNVNGAMSATFPQYPTFSSISAISSYWSAPPQGLLIFTFRYKRINP